MLYRVRWEIDVEADTPAEAARHTLAIQRNPDSTATVFDVRGANGKTVRVDLDDPGPLHQTHPN